MSDKKIKLFWATDSPTVSTGFGRVSYELIIRLLKTGRYEIHVMGTNDRGEPHPLRGEKDLYIHPLVDIEHDPYGGIEMPYLLDKIKPDVIFSLNDPWVWSGDPRNPNSENWFARPIKSYRPYVPWIGYFPVDGRPWIQEWVELINRMDYAVTFSDYGYETLMQTPGVNKETTKLIYHGASVDKFYPLPKDLVKKVRKEKLEIDNEEEVFLVGCVARNQPRKNIPLLIQSFKMFSDGYRECKGVNERGIPCGNYEPADTPFPDCELCGSKEFEYHKGVGTRKTRLYLHMNPMDTRGHKLYKIMEDNRVGNVIFRPQHHVAHGVPIEELNEIYNAMDVFVLPTYAGGYELPIVEAQAAGTPVITTRTTCCTEHVDNGKGFMVYPEASIILDDANHCYKHLMSKTGLVDMLFKLYNDRELLNSVIEPALEYAHSRAWDKPAEQFDELFQKAYNKRVDVVKLFKSKPEQRKLLIVNKTRNPAVLLSMMPVLSAAKKKHDAEVILACDPKIGNLIENQRAADMVVDANKLWMEGELQNASVQDVSGLIDTYEKNVAKFAKQSWEEAWFTAFNMKPESEKDLEMNIYFNNDDKKTAKELVPDFDGITVGLLVDHDNPTRSLDIPKWNGIMTFLGNVGAQVVVIGSNEFKSDKDNIIIVDANTKTRVQAACADRCDVLITLDNAWPVIGKALDKDMIIIQGPRDVWHKLNGFNPEKVTIIDEKEAFECMPCWIDVGERCAVTNSHLAQCLKAVEPSSVFKAFLKYKEKFESKGVVEVA